MEKFSTWRDPATGLAPFVYPVPPLSMSAQVPRLAWIPFVPLALCRTCLLVIEAILFIFIDRTCALLFFFSIKSFAVLQSYYTSAFARIALYLLGLTQLPSEPPFSHRTSSQKLIQTKVNPGDLIVCNWSSFIEIFYLTYLYNPIFIVPIPQSAKTSASGSAENITKGFEIKTALQLICSSGYPPNQNPSSSVKSLVQCIHESKRLMRVLVVFPEGTTSNNRALLKCFKLNKQSIGEHKGGKIKVFCLAIKHESSTSMKNSMTVPIPSEPLNLPNMLKMNLTPILIPFILSPRSITIRYPRKDFIELDLSSSSNESDQTMYSLFDLAFEIISTVAKLKVTSQINGLDKVNFLVYLKSRRSS